jgi:UDP-glucose 4-epimerase
MIVVFGAGGFIGTYLIDVMVEQKFRILAVDNDVLAQEYFQNKGIPFTRVDITKDEEFSKLPNERIEAAINVACLQPVNVQKRKYKSSNFINVNVIGTINILDYCCRNSADKLISTISHRGVQGLWTTGETVKEESTKALKYSGDFAMFSISECAALDCLEHYAQEYGIGSVVLRLPPVYGYGPHLEGYREGKRVKSGFMTFIEKAMNSEPIELWGDDERGRDIVYVKDVVSAIILSLKNDEARGLYNISSGEKVTLRREAEEIIRVFSPPERPSEIKNMPYRPNSVEPFHYDISKARSELQWFPRYPLVSMLMDIRQEMALRRYEYLVKRREQMFRE